MKLIAISNDNRVEALQLGQNKLSKQLNVAFVLYNLIAREELSKTNPVDTAIKEKVLNDISKKLQKYWDREFTPSLAKAYRLGSSNLSEEVVAAAAGKYSGMLFEQLNDVSDRAFIEGYYAALNKGWPKALAWQRVAQTYGLDPAQMRSWITYYPSEGYQPDEISEKALRHRDKLFGQRAERIAEHESRTVLNLGKQFGWSEKVKNGELPRNAKKVFMTAQDEKVCPECGPLDGKVIPLNGRFNGTLVPPLHVNCRCEIAIIHENAVVKSYNGDKYKRDQGGRFARSESRVFNPRSNASRGSQPVKIKAKPEAKKTQAPKTVNDIPYEVPDIIESDLMTAAELDLDRRESIANSQLSTGEYLAEEATEIEINNAVNNKPTVLSDELANEVAVAFKGDNDAQRVAEIIDAEKITSQDKKFLAEDVEVNEDVNISSQADIRARVKEEVAANVKPQTVQLQHDVFLTSQDLDQFSNQAEMYNFSEEHLTLDPQQSYNFVSAVFSSAPKEDTTYDDDYDYDSDRLIDDITRSSVIGRGHSQSSDVNINDEEDYESYQLEDGTSYISDKEGASTVDVFVIPKGTPVIQDELGIHLTGDWAAQAIDEIGADHWNNENGSEDLPASIAGVRINVLSSADEENMIKPESASYSNWNAIDDSDQMSSGEQLSWRNQ